VLLFSQVCGAITMGLCSAFDLYLASCDMRALKMAKSELSVLAVVLLDQMTALLDLVEQFLTMERFKYLRLDGGTKGFTCSLSIYGSSYTYYAMRTFHVPFLMCSHGQGAHDQEVQ
jgi:hypothetical protein